MYFFVPPIIRLCSLPLYIDSFFVDDNVVVYNNIIILEGICCEMVSIAVLARTKSSEYSSQMIAALLSENITVVCKYLL